MKSTKIIAHLHLAYFMQTQLLAFPLLSNQPTQCNTRNWHVGRHGSNNHFEIDVLRPSRLAEWNKEQMLEVHMAGQCRLLWKAEQHLCRYQHGRAGIVF